LTIVGGILKENPFFVPPDKFLLQLGAKEASVGTKRGAALSRVEVEMEETVDEDKYLKGCINNLISILALPAIWTGGDGHKIVKALLDALLGMLRLDFLYVELKGPAGSAPIEMSRPTQSENSAWQEGVVNEVLKASLRCETETWPLVVQKPTGEGDVSIAVFRLGLKDDMCVLVAGSRRTDFPDVSEKLILNAAVNQASIGLQEARLLGEQRRLAWELEHQAAQWTRELDQFFTIFHDLLSIADKHGYFWGLNPAWERILGYSRSELLARPFMELVHPEDVTKTRAAYADLIAGRNLTNFVNRLQCKDGAYRWLEWSAVAGDQMVYCTGRDITDRKHLEETLRRREEEIRSVIENIPAMVWSGLPDGSNVWENKRWADYAGLSATGFGWQAAVHPDDLGRHLDAFYESSAKGVPFQDEVRFRGADGEYRWFVVAAVPLRDEEGKIFKYYGIITDIEDRKRAEDSLQTAFDEIKKLKDQLNRENIVLREEIEKTSMFEEIVGASPALKAVLARVAKVASTDCTVLITGETGTGKELVARAIHKRSQRSSRAFVSVNCAAIPAPLIASELFGHEKGAFTGAHERRLGRFELAEGGTIFLDEMGELPTETQIALLRVLQEHEFERVGGNQAIRANVRVIAATNRDLKAAIEARIVRSDLFYRLNVFPIEMPPLRERKEDIPMLVEYFIDRYASKAGKKIRSINKKTLDLLQSYPWPGNIRELQNVIERSVIVCDTASFSVDESWLVRESCHTQPAIQPLFDRFVTQEQEMIEAALAASGGRVSGPLGAAAKLAIPPSTLESKIRSLKIDKHRFKSA
jgi:PAS domain S-box-containing protein